MEHKAFVFDHEQFDRELRPMVVRALETDGWAEIDRFVDTHLGGLTDPYSGRPLAADWRTAAAGGPEVHGAFALTRYYDRVANIGLHADWRPVFDALERAAPGAGSLTLGDPIESGGRIFDPGRLGTYLQSPLRIRTNLVVLDRLLREHAELVEVVQPLAEMLFAGVPKGLYVTF
jgi:hypothetical protein